MDYQDLKVGDIFITEYATKGHLTGCKKIELDGIADTYDKSAVRLVTNIIREQGKIVCIITERSTSSYELHFTGENIGFWCLEKLEKLGKPIVIAHRFVTIKKVTTGWWIFKKTEEVEEEEYVIIEPAEMDVRKKE